MTTAPSVDEVLVHWGERLFYPRVRTVKTPPPARLRALPGGRAAVIRGRIAAIVTRRAPQVMVKVTGGGRGMGAIAAHFRYISKNGRLAIEDERGVADIGKESVHDLVERWRYGGSMIEEVSPRREAFNIMLSMPHGTDPRIVLQAAREFAKAELKDHSYAMVLHEHQTNPHVHLAVRAESRFGTRLNPRKADLHRWRETFAEKLRGWGVEAEATRQLTRGVNRHVDPLWRLKAKEDGRLRRTEKSRKFANPYRVSQVQAVEAWAHIAQALSTSEQSEDRKLSVDVQRFLRESPVVRDWAARRQREGRPPMDASVQRPENDRGPEIGR
jgi:hypothetical protein